MRARWPWTVIVVILLLLVVARARADEPNPAAPTAEEVLDTMKQALAWAQQARATVQALHEAAVGVSAREEEQAVGRVLQRTFEAARARAVLVTHAPTTSDEERARASRRAARRAELEAAIRGDEREVERAQARVRAASRARREAAEREAAAAANRLALDRMRLELLNSLEQADVSVASAARDLPEQIQALQESVADVNTTASAKPATGAVAPPSVETWTSVHRLLALQRARTSLAQLALATEQLARGAEIDVTRTRDAIRDLARTLRTAAGVPSAPAPSASTSGSGSSPSASPETAPASPANSKSRGPGAGSAGSGAASATPMSEQEFRRELDRLKALGATLVPLRAEAALLRRFESDLRLWQRGIDRDVKSELQNLAVGLIGVVLALGAIFIGGIVWRIAVNRYITDPYRRRLALNARRIVLTVAFVLVLVFHFTSELTALVTALGFAAAGIAFALQNVILAVAGYFSMMAPNGIRVGDRVSLQGPFGYVQGEVIEIGMVRIRLRELSPDRLEPTGRIVVFPNSVVFTGSFFKIPPPPAVKAA